jgi:two-component system, OmpR family, sensor kinase
VSARAKRPRLLLRVYLYGLLLLALAGAASFLVGTYVITPAVELPARPSTTWIAWHLLHAADDRPRLEAELSDLKQRVRVEMTLFERDGRLIASNADQPPPALEARELEVLGKDVSHFDSGRGAVALLDAQGQLLRYARVSYPFSEPPLGSAMAQLAAALAVLALLSIPLARSITAPLERLGELARTFGSGELSARSGIQSKDEIGDLARAFDEMAERVVSLRRSEKELLANVSHELRTPLARIRMALDLVREGDTTRAAGYLEDIEDDLEELELLLDDVMTTARLDLTQGAAGGGLPPLRRELVSGAELIEAARSRFERRFPDRKLDHRVSDDVPDVEADPNLLRRVLDNLLDNAAKFSDPDSAIALEASADPASTQLVIDVRDHGIGIAQADRERIFEPFFRADRSRTRATGGVGLGLVLARRIVEAHGGSITCQSEPDRGSHFRVTVPVPTERAPS